MSYKTKYGQPGRYNSSLPTIPNGEGGALAIDENGRLISVGAGTGGAVEVIEQYAPTAEDNDAGVIKVEQRNTYQKVTADTQVVAGSGFLHTLTFSCNDAAPTAGSVIVYDSLSETGTEIFNHTFTITTFTPFSVVIDAAFATGLYVGFTTTNDVNVTVSYRAD